MAITIDSVIDALKYVDDPDLKKDLVWEVHPHVS